MAVKPGPPMLGLVHIGFLYPGQPVSSLFACVLAHSTRLCIQLGVHLGLETVPLCNIWDGIESKDTARKHCSHHPVISFNVNFRVEVLGAEGFDRRKVRAWNLRGVDILNIS